MDEFWNAFVPLFVAFDGIGLMPIYWALTHKISVADRRRAVSEAVITAFGVTFVFLFIGHAAFALMGLAFADVMIAGGIILIILCLRDLLFDEKPPSGRYRNPGVVPIGVPLLAGPAALTAVLLIREQHGVMLTLAVLSSNLILIWVMLRTATIVLRRVGKEGILVVSKIFSLILTAFGVMLIRRGIMMLVGK